MHRAILSGAIALSLLVATALPAQSLRGSRASIERMYAQAIESDLHFYETASGVRRAADSGTLRRLAGGVDYRLKDVSQPYVLPATHLFIQRLASQYRARCGEQLVVTSGTRPQAMRLANSSDKTVHPTGMAVDLRRPTRAPCLTWLRETLLLLEQRGVIEATEERNPAHFHIAVFPAPYERYVRGGAGKNATVRLASATTTPVASRASVGASPAGGRTYRVKRGDSLWTIARNAKVSVDVLKDANALSSSRIVAGQILTIPN